MRIGQGKTIGSGLALLAAAALLLAAASSALAGPGAGGRRLPVLIASSHSGFNAYTTTQGTLPGLSVLKVLAKATPKQNVTLTGKLNCGSGAKSFKFSGQAPLTRALQISGTKPRSCSISAKAQIGKHQGTVTLDVLGR